MLKMASIMEKHTFVFSWEFELDTNDDTVCLELPLATRFGEFDLDVEVEGPQVLTFSIWTFGLERAALGRDLKATAASHWVNSEGKSSFLTSEARHQLVTFPSRANDSFELEFEIKNNSMLSLLSKRPNDVRLVFPSLGAVLWESSTFLANSSPYFTTLLASSNFTESVRRKRKRSKTQNGGASSKLADPDNDPRSSKATANPTLVTGSEQGGGECDSDDSDEDSDDFLKRRSPPSVEDDSDDGDFTYREVNITETAYTTYRAVLLYLHSGHIAFAPLSCTLLPLNRGAQQTREQLLEAHLSSKPSQPFPVSPKSVYRLAHLLEIPSLCALSLAELRSQLTINNAARELFSKTSALYDDLRAVILAFVVKNWAEVKASEGMKEMETKARTGQLPHSAAIFFELLPLASK
ncbi:hypothetical protein BCR35DRAFT_334247 [Leucosporidium creatinivorum]|uniref:BTB domain-containing protein n=1 Tax=Leucosporidium creatinivorum TaxID=106004 RepID=A0A1Y2EDM7_9BASI|nr:hypothetical protein BCR35DRAFT_334247 [Leucosporidium creatinivorum]